MSWSWCSSAGKPWNDVLKAKGCNNSKRRRSPSTLCVLELDRHTLLVVNGAFHVLQFLCTNYLPPGYHRQLERTTEAAELSPLIILCSIREI